MRTIKQLLEQILAKLETIGTKTDQIVHELTDGGEPQASPELVALVIQAQNIAQGAAVLADRLEAMAK